MVSTCVCVCVCGEGRARGCKKGVSDGVCVSNGVYVCVCVCVLCVCSVLFTNLFDFALLIIQLWLLVLLIRASGAVGRSIDMCTWSSCSRGGRAAGAAHGHASTLQRIHTQRQQPRTQQQGCESKIKNLILSAVSARPGRRWTDMYKQKKGGRQ